MKVDLQKELGFPQIDSNVTAWLKFTDTNKEYELETFNIEFVQPTDYKGEPQGDVNGGQIIVTLSQIIEEDLIAWAISHSKKRNGIIEFRVESANAPMRIEFLDGCCINFSQKMNSIGNTGVETTIVITAEELVVNGINFYKHWTQL
jgi:hypothetical protein